MAQDEIIKGKDNPVVIEFGGINLLLVDDISAAFGNDTRTLLLNPSSFKVEYDALTEISTLSLYFGDTTETQSNYWVIFYTDALNPNGYDLTSKCLGNLTKTGVCN